jgi:hypothetical protein
MFRKYFQLTPDEEEPGVYTEEEVEPQEEPVDPQELWDKVCSGWGMVELPVGAKQSEW